MVYVIGHVTPEIYPQIAWNTQVNYFSQSQYAVAPELSKFFNGEKTITDLQYTKIKIEAASNQLKDDLWMQDIAPAKIAIANSVNTNPMVWMIALFAVISCLSSMLAGIIVFRRDSPSMI